VKVRWAATTTATGNVRWRLQSCWRDAGEVLGSWDSDLSVTDSIPTAAAKWKETTLATLAVEAAGQEMQLAVARMGTHAEDTYAADAGFLALILQYTG
jgi:hypothetical protein